MSMDMDVGPKALAWLSHNSLETGKGIHCSGDNGKIKQSDDKRQWIQPHLLLFDLKDCLKTLDKTEISQLNENLNAYKESFQTQGEKFSARELVLVALMIDKFVENGDAPLGRIGPEFSLEPASIDVLDFSQEAPGLDVGSKVVEWLCHESLAEGEGVCISTENGQIGKSKDASQWVRAESFTDSFAKCASDLSGPELAIFRTNLEEYEKSFEEAGNPVAADQVKNLRLSIDAIVSYQGVSSGRRTPEMAARPHSAPPLELSAEFGENPKEVEQSYYSWMTSMPQSVINAAYHVGQIGYAQASHLVRSYVLDGNHPWKQRIYELSLREMQTGLEELSGKELPVLIGEYNDLAEPTELQELILGCLKAIEAPPEGPYRKQYLNFVLMLRAALEKPEYQELLTERLKPNAEPNRDVDTLLMICKARFTKVEIFQFLDELVELMINLGSAELGLEAKEVGLEPEEVDLNEGDFNALANIPPEAGANRAAVALGCARGTFNINFDPHAQANKPYTWGKFGIGAKSREWHRFGSPTIEGYMEAGARINPEFQAFLHSMKLDKKTHVYFNLQNFTPKRLGDETARVKAIVGLEQQFPGTFYCVTLSQDTKFYKQKGEEFGVEAYDAQAFQDRFLEEMFDKKPEESGFYFPADLGGDSEKARAFKSGIKAALGELSKALYPEQPNLSILERQDLIEIFYAVLELMVIQTLDVDSFNLACKDAIDRAGKNSAILFRLMGIARGVEQTGQHRKDTRTIAHAAAFVVKKQPIIEGRKDRLLTAVERMSHVEGNPEKLKGIVNNRGLVSLKDPTIERKAGLVRPTLEGVEQKEEEVQLTGVEAILSKMPYADLNLLAGIDVGQKLGVQDGQLYTSSGNAEGWVYPWIQSVARTVLSGAGASRGAVIAHGHQLNERLGGIGKNMQALLEDESVTPKDLREMANLRPVIQLLEAVLGTVHPDDSETVSGGWGYQMQTYLKTAPADIETQDSFKEIRENLTGVIELFKSVVQGARGQINSPQMLERDLKYYYDPLTNSRLALQEKDIHGLVGSSTEQCDSPVRVVKKGVEVEKLQILQDTERRLGSCTYFWDTEVVKEARDSINRDEDAIRNRADCGELYNTVQAKLGEKLNARACARVTELLLTLGGTVASGFSATWLHEKLPEEVLFVHSSQLLSAFQFSYDEESNTMTVIAPYLADIRSLSGKAAQKEEKAHIFMRQTFTIDLEKIAACKTREEAFGQALSGFVEFTDRYSSEKTVLENEAPWALPALPQLR